MGRPVGVGRRAFLQGAASLAAVGPGAALMTPQRVAAHDGSGLRPISMAMHVHGAYSEGVATMETHLVQAERTGVDVVWWTEHDHRMVARDYLDVVHFDDFTESTGRCRVTWTPQAEGEATVAVGRIVSAPVSPHDTGSGALRLAVTSAGVPAARLRYRADVTNMRLRTSLDGTTVLLDVFPIEVGKKSWLEIRVVTSYRPQRGSRAAGQYTMVYRLGGNRKVGSVERVDDVTAVRTVEGERRSWSTLRLSPAADLRLAWPGVDFRDASLYELSIGATSRAQAPARVVVDRLRVRRERRSAEEVLAAQQELMAWYAERFPSVRQHQGLEFSTTSPHLNWYGSPEILPADAPEVRSLALAVDRIHRVGGLASYNHPFGTSGSPMSDAAQTTKRQALATQLVDQRMFGADILEVGYGGGRAGMPLSQYVALWDTLSRNGIFVTGNGVSDDHSGKDWLALQWRYVTWAWATGTGEAALLSAVEAGRVWFADLARYTGSLDLVADDGAPMGSVSVAEQDVRDVRIVATDLPTEGAVAVVRGEVDYAGPGEPDPLVSREVLPAADFVSGGVDVAVDTTTSCFVRVEVFDSAGVVRGFSNPLWLLRAEPPGGVPDARRPAGPPPEED